MVFTPCIVSSAADSQENLNEQLLYDEIDLMLANNHVSDEIVFFVNKGFTLSEVSLALESIGVPHDFNDSDKYPYCSYQDESLDFTVIWFKLRVNPNEMRDTLYKLKSCGAISSVFPNYIFSYANAENSETIKAEFAWIDSQVAAEAAAALESIDNNTTDYAFDSVGIRESWKAGFYGKSTVTIGVLDSGYNPHEDVDPARIVNPWDATDLKQGTTVTDSVGHGTFIVGQICAKLNGNGVTGYTKNILVSPIRVGDAEGPNGDAVIRGIQYAEQNGIDIINLSCSFPDEWYDTLVAEGINFSGIVTLCAQNHSCDIENAPFMSGALEVPDNWIVVGNSNELDECYTSSNYSKLYVDLFAPGTNIRGLDKDGESYTSLTGTSMAAPHVAAAAAILMSHATHLSVLEIRQLLLACVDPIDDLEEKCVSGGRLSLINAVNELYSAPRPLYSFGDATGDGIINVVDYMMIKRIVLGTYNPTANQTLGSDADNDGIVSTQDYMMVKRYTLSTYYFSPT